jgi:hypothetical protein
VKVQDKGKQIITHQTV